SSVPIFQATARPVGSLVKHQDGRSPGDPLRSSQHFRHILMRVRQGRHVTRVRPFGMGKTLHRFICVLVPLIAAGCSMANLMGTEDMRPEPAPEPDYRRIVAEGVKPNLKDTLAFAPLEISPIRRTTRNQYGDWMVCVRGRREARPVYFGVFMKEHRILNW